jgi:HSP20 family molecular chaperone IbpA
MGTETIWTGGWPRSIFAEMFDTFEMPFRTLGASPASDVDYVETDGELVIYVRAPGYSRDDLTIEQDGGTLRVTGQLPEKPSTSLVHSKINYEFTLGTTYKVEEASHENGILVIRTSRVKQSEAVKIPVLQRAR